MVLGTEKVELLLEVEKKFPDQVREHEQYLVDQLASLTVQGAHLFLTTWFEKARPQVADDDSADGTPPDGGGNHIDRAGTLGGTHVSGFLDPEHAAAILGATEAEIDAWFRDGLLDGDTSRVILRGGSEVLDVGMRERLATAAQRRGLIAAASGRCEFPGCDASPDRCQVHHLDPFDPKAGTGPTDMANLALVCHRHHHAVHEGKFKMARGPNGVIAHRPDGTLLEVTKHHRPGPNTPGDG